MSCVEVGRSSNIEDLFCDTEVLCLGRVLADPNTLPSKEWQRPRHYRSSSQRFGSSVVASVCKVRSLRVGFSSAPCQEIFGRSTAKQSLDRIACVSADSLRIEFQKLTSTMGQISSECTMGLEFLYLRGQGLERLHHLRLRSPRPLIPLSNSHLAFSPLR